jgi:hypothetical protein
MGVAYPGNDRVTMVAGGSLGTDGTPAGMRISPREQPHS